MVVNLPSLEIEGLSGNICCLIEDLAGLVLGCFFDSGFATSAGCVWIRHRKSRKGGCSSCAN
jgi:hypothetical protein